MKFTWQVYTDIGELIVDDLPHPPHSSWTIDEQSKGSFVIPLFEADEAYEGLEIGLRVEAYEDGAMFPLFVGVIEERSKDSLYGRSLL